MDVDNSAFPNEFLRDLSKFYSREPLPTPPPTGKTIFVEEDDIFGDDDYRVLAGNHWYDEADSLTVYGTPRDDVIRIDGADNVTVYPGAGNDFVSISDDHDGWANYAVVVDDLGNDIVEISGGSNHSIITGSGDDNVDYTNRRSTGEIGSTKIDTGGNDDKVLLSSSFGSGDITDVSVLTRSGNDRVSLDADVDDPDFPENGAISLSTFDLGEGDDRFDGDLQTDSNTIYGGNGNDRITEVAGSNHDVVTGLGNDSVSLSAPSIFTASPDGTAKDTEDVTVSTGKGNDSVTFDAPEDSVADYGRIISNSISLGEGNDSFTDGIQTASNQILGGLGKDIFYTMNGKKENSYDVISSQGDQLVDLIG